MRASGKDQAAAEVVSMLTVIARSYGIPTLMGGLYNFFRHALPQDACLHLLLGPVHFRMVVMEPGAELLGPDGDDAAPPALRAALNKLEQTGGEADAGD